MHSLDSFSTAFWMWGISDQSDRTCCSLHPECIVTVHTFTLISPCMQQTASPFGVSVSGYMHAAAVLLLVTATQVLWSQTLPLIAAVAVTIEK